MPKKTIDNKTIVTKSFLVMLNPRFIWVHLSVEFDLMQVALFLVMIDPSVHPTATLSHK